MATCSAQLTGGRSSEAVTLADDPGQQRLAEGRAGYVSLVHHLLDGAVEQLIDGLLPHLAPARHPLVGQTAEDFGRQAQLLRSAEPEQRRARRSQAEASHSQSQPIAAERREQSKKAERGAPWNGGKGRKGVRPRGAKRAAKGAARAGVGTHTLPTAQAGRYGRYVELENPCHDTHCSSRTLIKTLARSRY